MLVTLKQIKDANACTEGYRKLAEYVRDNKITEPFSPAIILKSNDIQNTLWVLDNVCGDTGARICQEFALGCAERVLPIFEREYPDDMRPREAVEATRGYLDGTVTLEELRGKVVGVRDATSAAYACVRAADAAAYAAASAATTASAAYDAIAFIRAEAAADAAADAASAAADAAAYATAAVDAASAAADAECVHQAQELARLIEGV